jgi:hypothetical protein
LVGDPVEVLVLVAVPVESFACAFNTRVWVDALVIENIKGNPIASRMMARET